jgi:hypothetical protein
MKLILLIFNLLFITLSTEAKEMNNLQEMNIVVLDPEVGQGIKIGGTLSVFVKCGSQYAIWEQFPANIPFVLKDLDTDNVYESNYIELSISWDGNNVYEEYAEEPCDQVVSKDFTLTLTSVYLTSPPKTEVSNFELKAVYSGFSSNTLVIKGEPIILNSTVGLFL